MARCTRANIHPSRLPPHPLSPSASAPFNLRAAMRRGASRLSLLLADTHFGPAFSTRHGELGGFTDYLRLETNHREDTRDILSPLERIADC